MPKSIWSNYGSCLKVGWEKSWWKRVLSLLLSEFCSKFYRILTSSRRAKAYWPNLLLYRMQGSSESWRRQSFYILSDIVQDGTVTWLQNRALQTWVIRWHNVSAASRAFKHKLKVIFFFFFLHFKLILKEPHFGHCSLNMTGTFNMFHYFIVYAIIYLMNLSFLQITFSKKQH